MNRQVAIVCDLALKDCRQEWPSALCMVLSITAVLVPILLLLSIRSGIVGQIQNELSDNISARELVTIGEPKITAILLEKYANDPKVGFVAPRTRLLSASAVIRSSDLTKSIEVDMIPSGPGDPHLKEKWSKDSIAITGSAARELMVQTGQKIELILDRKTTEGNHEQIRLTRSVVEIADTDTTGKNLNRAYLPIDFVTATERWREDPEIKDLNEARKANLDEGSKRSYSGLRIFAKNLDQVEYLREEMLRDGIETDSQVNDIRLAKRLNESMVIFIGSLASLMIIGLIVALAAIQWGWVERKRFDYSYLRLLGMNRIELALLPIFQAALMVLPAASLSLGLTYIAESIINRLFAGQIAGIRQISNINPAESLLAIAVTFLIAAIGAFFAARSASQVSPIEALRGI